MIGMDGDILMLAAQKVAGNLLNLRVRLTSGWKAPYKGMSPSQHKVVMDRIDRDVSGTIWKALIQGLDNREFIDEKVYYPLMDPVDVMKVDIMGDMPKDLVDLTWTCRHPKNGAPCQRCHGCHEVALAREEYLKTKVNQNRLLGDH